MTTKPCLVLPLLLALMLCAAARPAWAQGQGSVSFSNSITNAVTNCLTSMRVTNDGTFRVALYWAEDGITEENLFTQLGPSIGFSPSGIFNGGGRTVPGVSGGTAAMFQVRVWELAYGLTWEEALSRGPINCRLPNIGKSRIVRVITTAFPTPPAPLHIPPFMVCPPPCVTITCPSDMTVVATDADGAPASFAAFGSNFCCPPTNFVTCNPASGSTFPIGTSTVNCVVHDGVGGPSNTCSFIITVRLPRTNYVSLTGSDTFPYTSWATAARNIQSAINAASDRDTVLVTNGTYNVSPGVMITKALNFRSVNGAAATIIDGQGTSRCIFSSNSLAMIDGFTVRNGHAPLAADDSADGGGIYLVGGVVQNCIVTNCTGSFAGFAHGGGIYMVGGLLTNSLIIQNGNYEGQGSGGGVYSLGGGRIERCELRRNSAINGGAGIYLVDGVMIGCWVSESSAGVGGGGIYALFSTVADCVISNNVVNGDIGSAAGGGAYLHGSVLDRCLVITNKAGVGINSGYGGGIFCMSNATIRSTVVAANQATRSSSSDPGLGGGVYLVNSALLNSTVTGNNTDQGAGAVYVLGSTVTNTISYFNTASSNANWHLVSGSIRYSCTTPDPGGLGNIIADPSFVNRAASNYRLSASSPCLDAGTNQSWMIGTTDLDGNSRIRNGRVDIGAYESPCLGPLITVQPLSQTACAFSTAGFTITTSGSHPQTFQWQRNGVNLSDGTRFSGTATASLTISNVQTADVGSYRVIVTNACGGITSLVASLSVRLLPAIGLNPVSQSNCVGSTVAFNATASGSIPRTHRWQKDGVDLVNNARVSGVTTTNLLITNLQPGDQGNYSLFVSNSCSVTNSLSAFLTVLTPPVVTNAQVVDLKTNVGATVTLRVFPQGSVPRSLQWRFLGTDLINGGRISGATSPTLTIANAQPSDSGRYSIFVSNACGSVTNTIANLVVADCPQITLQPVSDSRCVGSTASFRIAVVGTAPLFISWYRNSELLEDDGRISGASTTNLVISNIDINDAGDYIALIANACGYTNTLQVQLAVLTPPEITLQPQSKVAYEHNTVSFSSDAVSNLTNYFRWHFNGIALPGADTPSLIINNVTKAHAGDYTVVISNSCAVVTSAVATLAVPDCLSITAQPVSQEVAEGSSATFSVTVSGGPILSYRWHYNDVELNDDVLTSGSYTPELRVLDVATNHVGYYSVVISNFCGFFTSAPAALTLSQPLVAATAPPSLGDLRLSKAGFLRAVVVQPDGKVIVGGIFNSINGVARNNLARLNPNGSVDATWDAGISGFNVQALALDGTNVFVAGNFTRIGGQFRNGLAKLSTSNNGAAHPLWNPNPNPGVMGGVFALAVWQTNVFVGGAFTNVGGLSRIGLAKLSAAGTGAADPLWNADVDAAGYISALIAAGGSLYVGGNFASLRGNACTNLARLSLTGGGIVDNEWNPRPNSNVNAFGIQGSDLFVGGGFSRIANADRPALAKFHLGTGELDVQWNPTYPGGVDALAVLGTNLYVGGSLAGVAKIQTTGVGASDPLWNPTLAFDSYGPTIDAVATTADGVFAGGWLTDASGAVSAGMAKLNPFTGARVSSFPVQLESPGTVFSMVRQPDGKVIIGGDFLFAGGLVRRNLARLNLGGTVDPAWLPSAYGQVQALALAGTDLFVGGFFPKIGTNTQLYLAKVATAGSDAVDPNWKPRLNGPVFSLAAGPSNLFVGGAFTLVNDRPLIGLCKLSLRGSAVLETNWNLAPSHFAGPAVNALLLNGNDLYVGGRFNRLGGVFVDNLARVNSQGTGAVDVAWQPDPDNDVTALALAGTNLYVGGSFYFLGGQLRSNLAKVGLAGSGLADPVWKPNPDGAVLALAAEGSAVYAGGNFNSIANQTRRYLAKLTDSGIGELDPTWNHDAFYDADIAPMHFPLGVRTLLLNGSDLHVGGHFTRVDGVSRVGYVFLAVPDAPTMFVTNSTIIIQRNAADGREVTHFRITEIVGGNLFRSDGITPINEGDFVTVAEGGRGLKFVGTNEVQTLTAVSAFSPTPAGTGTEAATLDISVGGVPAFSFSQSSYEVSEGVDPALVEVTVMKRNPGEATVSFVWEPLSAEPYQYRQGDFLPLGTITTFHFGAEQTRTNIEFFIYNDDVREGDEHFRVTLVGNSAGSKIVLPAQALVTIVDDECTGEQGSWVHTNSPAALPPLTGGLSLVLNPAGYWRLPGDPIWRPSGSTAAGLAPGVYEVTFRPLQDGSSLPSMSFQVNQGEITAPLPINYPNATPVTQGEGGLTVFILPQPAATALWKIASGSQWLPSGARIALAPGIYQLQFSDVAPWYPPGDIFATVGPGLESTLPVYFQQQIPPTTGSFTPQPLPFSQLQHEPYHYNGLIETEVPTETGSQIRFGSGVVVKERVVLTAAHVLFDDKNLTYVTRARWYFQKHLGNHEPQPQTPQGWYIRAGYDLQRQIDKSPDISTPESQALDIAAMFFIGAENTPGRGGYGGFVASDNDANEWLHSTRPKILVGYPLDPQNPPHHGQLHASPQITTSFQQLYPGKRVYANDALHSFPGNSGGPLYVQADDGHFYPTAVYLGGYGRLLVRAIDKDAVCLINSAEQSSHGGGHHVGGGVALWAVSDTAKIYDPGIFGVYIGPTNITNVAGWRVKRNKPEGTDLSEYYKSGEFIFPTEAGEFIVEFQTVPGWGTPTNRLGLAKINHIISVTNEYVPLLITNLIHLQSGAFQFFVQGMTGRAHIIQVATHLPNFAPLKIVTNPNGSFIFTDPNPQPSRRFYRIKEQRNHPPDPEPTPR